MIQFLSENLQQLLQAAMPDTGGKAGRVKQIPLQCLRPPQGQGNCPLKGEKGESKRAEKSPFEAPNYLGLEARTVY